MKDVAITQTITLGQLLKKINVVQSGGETKLFLQTHHVTVNGIPEQRRGRKLNAGDIVCVFGTGQWALVRAQEL